MKRKKICHISYLYPPYFTGHGYYLDQRVFKTFKEKGIDNIIITANFDDKPEDEIKNGVEIHRVPLKKESSKGYFFLPLRAFPYLFKIRNQFSIIHMHGFWDMYGLLILFAKIFRKKTILHMVLLGHDDPAAIEKSYKFMWLRFKYLSKINAFIALSSPMTESYKKVSLPKERIFQIPQGVDIKQFHPPSSSLQKDNIRKQLAFPEQDKIALFVGAIIERKGVGMLIEAWKHVQENLKNVSLILVGLDNFHGHGKEIETLNEFSKDMKRIVKKDKLNVTFVGESDRVPLYMRASDLFILPSQFEGMPNVVIEAMATGLPVILTEMEGIAYDLILPDEQGYVVQDSKELADKIIYLFNNKEKSIQMGKNARKRAQEKFNLENICDQYLNLYDSLLQK